MGPPITNAAVGTMELREAVLLGVLKDGMRDVKNADVDFNLFKHVKRFFSLKMT